MAYLPDLQREESARVERMKRAYDKVCQVRQNETQDDIWRREQAGLEWIADFLMESNAFLRNCIFDGYNLKRPNRAGQFNSINAGYHLGFEVPLGGPISFSLYVMHLSENRKEIYQCPECKVVYSLPQLVDITRLRKIKKPKPIMFG